MIENKFFLKKLNDNLIILSKINQIDYAEKILAVIILLNNIFKLKFCFFKNINIILV